MGHSPVIQAATQALLVVASAVSGNVCDAPGTGSEPLHRRVRHAFCGTFCSGLRLSEVREIGSYGAASAYGLVGQPALEDSAPSRGRVPLASSFVPTMQRATPGTRTLPSFSNALTFAMALVRIRSRASSSTC